LSQEEAPKASAPKTSPIIVEVMNGPEDGREITCSSLPITIGRSNENSIGLSCDQLISRRHAKIETSEHVFFLEDLKSTNGTFIENKKIKKGTPIEPDKLFRVGATLLRIKMRTSQKSAD
jgi:pSer/pThr/pTyr-binding forkhead associated (FHA) protein